MPITASPSALRPQALALRHGRELSWAKRPLIMGVLNLTPDSFSDGGLWIEPTAAVEHARRMVEHGADLLDLGAESTRPGGGVYGQGADRVRPSEELRRLLPVLEAVRREVEVPISVDTRKGSVAREALQAGADLINDISGLEDQDLAVAVREAECPVILMHSRGSLESMQREVSFQDLLGEVGLELESMVNRASSFGVERRQILVDPGIGYGKTGQQNLSLLRHLDLLGGLELPCVVGASRKSFIGEITGAAVDQRLSGSLAAVSWAAHHGAAMVRVHDVADTHQFLTVWQAIDIARGAD